MKKLTFNERGYLIPNEPIEADLETLEKYFVTAFPCSTTRRKLFDNYLRFVYRMQDEVFPFFEQWIDGSFVSMKENPNDIDVMTFIDYRVWNTRSEKKWMNFGVFHLKEKVLRDADDLIESSKRIESDLMVRQYEYMKSKYIKELLEMLGEYRITINDFLKAA